MAQDHFYQIFYVQASRRVSPDSATEGTTQGANTEKQDPVGTSHKHQIVNHTPALEELNAPSLGCLERHTKAKQV